MEDVTICPPLGEILEVMHDRDYAVFEDPDGHDLNLIGIRSASIEPRRFEDWIAVAYRHGTTWNFFPFPASTDPGTFWGDRPDRVRGEAVLCPGQHRGLWRPGRYRGARALRQVAPASAWAAVRREHFLDPEGMPETTLHSGVDLVRAPDHDDGKRWSAGCQVLQDPDHFRFLIALCERARRHRGGALTYTLLEEADFVL